MRFIAAFLIVSALLSTVAFAQDMRPVRSITVTGKAERKVVPDEAHVVVNISALNAKLPAAKTEHDQKLRKVMDIAKANGIADAQMKTQSSNVQPQYSYDNNVRSFKGYQVTTSLDITVKKIDAVGGLLEKLTAAGLENKADPNWMGLINVNYTISNPDALRDEMTTDAIKNARAKADRMASAAGAGVGPVYQINEGNGPSFNYPRAVPMMAMAKMAGGAADAAMAPPPGEQEVEATVTVSYELK